MRPGGSLVQSLRDKLGRGTPQVLRHDVGATIWVPATIRMASWHGGGAMMAGVIVAGNQDLSTDCRGAAISRRSSVWRARAAGRGDACVHGRCGAGSSRCSSRRWSRGGRGDRRRRASWRGRRRSWLSIGVRNSRIASCANVTLMAPSALTIRRRSIGWASRPSRLARRRVGPLMAAVHRPGQRGRGRRGARRLLCNELPGSLLPERQTLHGRMLSYPELLGVLLAQPVHDGERGQLRFRGKPLLDRGWAARISAKSATGSSVRYCSRSRFFTAAATFACASARSLGVGA